MPLPTKPQLNFSPSTLFDAIIIGAGPAGLSAALALCRMKRTTVVFSTNSFRNDRAQHAHTVLSRDHQPPSEIRRVGREQIEAYGTTHFVQRAVLSARNVLDGGREVFEVEDDGGEGWKGKKVVLAMGTKDVLPKEIEGYEDCWGESIYQCLFCDGLERSDRPAGMLGWSAMAPHGLGLLLLLGLPRVTVFGNGPVCPEGEAAERALEVAKARGVVVDERRIQRLVHLEDGEGIEIQFEDGESTRVGFLQHSPPTEIVGAGLAKDLGVEIVLDGFGGKLLKTNGPLGETNVKGVFAAGDLSTLMKQVTTAMQQGVSAGAGIAMQLAQEAGEEAVAKLWPQNGRADGRRWDH